MRLEIDIPEHHYNNIMAFDSVNLGRVPYKGIIMYAINAIKHGKVLDQEPTDNSFTKADIDAIVKAINEGWKLRVNEILDKIRAEILEDCGYSKDYVGAFTYSTIKLKTVLQIIDKYKAETEAEDG